MPRETLDRELQRLQDETLVLGSLVGTQSLTPWRLSNDGILRALGA